jgi:hypothetical protein
MSDRPQKISFAEMREMGVLAPTIVAGAAICRTKQYLSPVPSGSFVALIPFAAKNKRRRKRKGKRAAVSYQVEKEPKDRC